MNKLKVIFMLVMLSTNAIASEEPFTEKQRKMIFDNVNSLMQTALVTDKNHDAETTKRLNDLLLYRTVVFARDIKGVNRATYDSYFQSWKADMKATMSLNKKQILMVYIKVSEDL